MYGLIYVDVVRRVSVRRLARLRGLIDAEGLSGLLLFEGDFVAYKLAGMQHFDAALVTRDNVYVIVDSSLQHKALREGSWDAVDVMVIENFCLSELVGKVMSLLPRRGSGVRLGTETFKYFKLYLFVSENSGCWRDCCRQGRRVSVLVLVSLL